MKTKQVDSYSANSISPPSNVNAHNFKFLTKPKDFDPIKSGTHIRHLRPRISTFNLFEGDGSPPAASSASAPPGSGGFSDYIQNWKERTLKKKILYRKLPILSWLQDYSWNKLWVDLFVGITIGLTILPQGLAYATIAGLPPQYGLYSGIIGPFVYVLLGTSKFITIGPTAGMSMITLTYIAETGAGVPLTILLTFLTGIITLILGIFHLGFVSNFISVPVLSAFTSAMGIVICSTQLPAILGLKFTADGFIPMMEATIEHLPDANIYDAILAVSCVVILLALKRVQAAAHRLFKKIPHRMDNLLWFIATARNFIVVSICTGWLGYIGGDIHPVQIMGEMKAGLPSFAPPKFKFTTSPPSGNETELFNEVNNPERLEYSIGYFLTENRAALILVPLIAIAEHMTVAKSLDWSATGRIDQSQEMTCIGLSNLIGSFLGSMPVTGSFTRPNVKHARAHGRSQQRDQSPLGGCATGVLVLLALLYLIPYLYHIPNATLAAVIVSGVIEEFDLGIVRLMWRSKKMDLIPWTATFVVGVLVHLEHGILLGLGLSVVYILYYAALPQIKVHLGESGTGKKFIMVELDRSLIFPSVDYSQYALVKAGTRWGHDKYPVVINCQHIQFADYSAAHGIKNIFHAFNGKSQRLTLWKVKPAVLSVVTGVLELTRVPFMYCSTEQELEEWLDAKNETDRMGTISETANDPGENDDNNIKKSDILLTMQ